MIALAFAVLLTVAPARPTYGTVSVQQLRGQHVHRVRQHLPYVPVPQRDYEWRALFPLRSER